MDLDFTKFRDAFAVQFDKMCKAHDHLFITATDKDLLWDAYLSAFPPGSDPMHRTRTTHDCSICRSFIRDLGNVVAITDQGLVSVWDFTCGEPAYDTVARAMSAYARSFLVKGRFLALLKGYGSLTTYANAQGVAERYDHFCVEVPSGHRLPGSSDSHASAMAEGAANAAVLGRSLNEISADAVRVVLELIAQDSIYRAAEWKPALKRFLALKEGYHKATDKNSFTWLASCKEGGAVTRMRNHSIGTLLVDIAEGVPLDEAVRKYEAIVAPTNYKRPKAVYTARMLEAAKAESEESLLTTRPKGTDDLRVKIDIVKHIVADKQREMADRLNAAVVREREQRILRAMADKDDEALRSMTKEELQALLANGK